jgi:hypothetical protein
MIKTLAVNENNDIYIGDDGNLAIAEGIDAVKILCAQAVKVLRDEMVLHVDKGMPNFQLIWNGAPNIAQYEALLRKTLLNVQGVVKVSELSVNYENNILKYTANIETIYGVSALDG